MAKNKVIALREDIPNTAGALIWWTLTGNMERSAFHEAWVEAGLDPEDEPGYPTERELLSLAVREQKQRNRLARPLKKEGGEASAWALVDETNDGNDLDYDVICHVSLDAIGRPVVTHGKAKGYAKATSSDADIGHIVDEIGVAYERYLNLITQNQISRWVLTWMDRFRAVRMRDRGGVYFIGPQHLPQWKQIRGILRSVGEHRPVIIPAMRSEEAVQDIVESLAVEATNMADKMWEELSSGELKAGALETRAGRCDAMKSKVAEYEKLLGAKMTDVQKALKKLKTTLTAAALAADTDETRALEVGSV